MYINFDKCIKEAGGVPFKNVLHIGAHYGQEAEAYENNGVKKVIWVDANSNVFSELWDHTQKFSLEQYYFDVCLSDKEEETTFHVANNGENNTNGQSSSLLEFGTHARMYPHITYVDHQKVTTERYDKWIEGITPDIVEEIDFVNLDVQGAELRVLKGFGEHLASPDLRAIYTEINLEEVYKDCCQIEDLDEYLGQYGFKRTLVAVPEGTWGDALYLKTP